MEEQIKQSECCRMCGVVLAFQTTKPKKQEDGKYHFGLVRLGMCSNLGILSMIVLIKMKINDAIIDRVQLDMMMGGYSFMISAPEMPAHEGECFAVESVEFIVNAKEEKWAREHDHCSALNSDQIREAYKQETGESATDRFGNEFSARAQEEPKGHPLIARSQQLDFGPSHSIGLATIKTEGCWIKGPVEAKCDCGGVVTKDGFHAPWCSTKKGKTDGE